MTSIRTLVAACLVCATAGSAFTYHTAYRAGHEAGFEVGIVHGRIELVNEVEALAAKALAAKSAKDAKLLAEANAYVEKTKSELTRLGVSEKRAKQELADYIKTKKEEAYAPNDANACRTDSAGISTVDVGIVRMLNAARDGSRSSASDDTDPQAPSRADAESQAAPSVTWADVARGDLDATQAYQAIAARHDKLAGWVETFCKNEE